MLHFGRVSVKKKHILRSAQQSLGADPEHSERGGRDPHHPTPPRMKTSKIQEKKWGGAVALSPPPLNPPMISVCKVEPKCFGLLFLIYLKKYLIREEGLLRNSVADCRPRTCGCL